MNAPLRASHGVIINANLVTLDGPDYGMVRNGCIAWRDGEITYVGTDSGNALIWLQDAEQAFDAKGNWLTPALIDCHTHLVFAGNRAEEAEQRLNGASYEDIAKAGGGILSSVRSTREASEEELFTQSLPRLQALIADGVACVEIKSGYGLDLANERKMLRVARRLGEHAGITVKTTYLAAHALPAEFSGRSDDYIDAVCVWLPHLHGEGLIDAVDVFCEGIGFSSAQSRRVFEAARALGLPVKCHADQLSDLSGAALVAEFSGLSADHVEYTSDESVRRMAAAGTVAVLLPGAFHVLRETKLPPMAAFREHGVPMAVATDCNPGTAPLLSLRLAMAMACTHFRLTPEEALRGATLHAAKALGLGDRGRLAVGQRADFALWNIRHPAELCYWLGGDLLERLILSR
ncbi:MAG TPA: imidazolonepropionase [Arenimonas sp.]|nr:imidazolonepropionase [Arenimonas sp.]